MRARAKEGMTWGRECAEPRSTTRRDVGAGGGRRGLGETVLAELFFTALSNAMLTLDHVDSYGD